MSSIPLYTMVEYENAAHVSQNCHLVYYNVNKLV